MEPLALEPPAGLGGSEMLYRGGGQKMASRGGRPVIYPPPTHTYAIRTSVEMFEKINDFSELLRISTTVSLIVSK